VTPSIDNCVFLSKPPTSSEWALIYMQ